MAVAFPLSSNQSMFTISNEVSNVAGWDKFVESHPHGSPFHLTAWQRLIRNSFGFEPKHIVARDLPGGDVVGLLPLFLVRSAIANWRKNYKCNFWSLETSGTR